MFVYFVTLSFDTEEILLLPFQTKLRFHSLGPILFMCLRSFGYGLVGQYH